jgi:hypothetical protein
MESGKCAHETCRNSPKEMVGGYCKKHQRFRLHKEGLVLGKHFCRNFFRGCDSEVTEGVKTCTTCLAKNKIGKTFCAHKGCKFQVDGDEYCGKHSRDKYYDEAKKKGIRYCDVARGCYKVCEEGKASCDTCLNVSRTKEKTQYDERVLATEILRNTLMLNVRVCIMCSKEFDCFMTKHNKESVKCRHCQEIMHKQDDKRGDRGRVYKKECLENIKTYMNQYIKGAKKRNIAFELSKEQFTRIVTKPCHYCNYIKEGEANGIDRVDNNDGYSDDNCVACCRICNRMKHAYHLDFFLEKMKQISTSTPPSNEFITRWQQYYPLKTVSYKKYKSSTAKRNVPLTLTEAQYTELTHNPCYLCGYSNTDGIGIDRMDNTVRSYTYENCRSCCHSCNIMKATESHSEFLAHCAAITKTWPL